MTEENKETETGMTPASRVHFPGISPTAWEHPTDRTALETLRKVPALDQVLKKVFGSMSERGLRLMYLANAVRVGPDQFPRLHQIHQEDQLIFTLHLMQYCNIMLQNLGIPLPQCFQDQ